MVTRKGWNNLSDATRARYRAAGITKRQYQAGVSLKAARGHAHTPEQPRVAYAHPDRYRGYLRRRAIRARTREAAIREGVDVGLTVFGRGADNLPWDVVPAKPLATADYTWHDILPGGDSPSQVAQQWSDSGLPSDARYRVIYWAASRGEWVAALRDRRSRKRRRKSIRR